MSPGCPAPEPSLFSSPSALRGGGGHGATQGPTVSEQRWAPELAGGGGDSRFPQRSLFCWRMPQPPRDPQM